MVPDGRTGSAAGLASGYGRRRIGALHYEAHGRWGRELPEAVPTVKGNRPFVDSLGDYVAARNDLNGAYRAAERVDKELAAEALALEHVVDGELADEDCRDLVGVAPPDRPG